MVVQSYSRKGKPVCSELTVHYSVDNRSHLEITHKDVPKFILKKSLF